MDLNDQQWPARFLLRDHDAKFTRPFDEVFPSEGVEVIRTPIRAPKANAHAERWVQTVRAECLDWTLVVGRRHLLRLLRAYVRHYNEQRPHRGLALAVPQPRDQDRDLMRSGSQRSGVAMCLAVSSTSITGSRPDESGFPRPQVSR
jgi:transposase InsO family protein